MRLKGDLMRRDTNALMPGGGHLQETAGTLNRINQGTAYKGEDRVLGDHSVLRVFLTSWAKETRTGEQFQEPEFRKNLAVGQEPEA